MQYDIPLPRRVTGEYLISAFHQVAEKRKWQYSSQTVAYSVFPKPNFHGVTFSFAPTPKTLQLTLSREDVYPDYVGNDSGQITILVNPKDMYSTITVNNAGFQQGSYGSQTDEIPPRTLDDFVTSLHDELRKLR